MDALALLKETQARLNSVLAASVGIEDEDAEGPITIDVALAVFQLVFEEVSAATQPMSVDVSALNAPYVCAQQLHEAKDPRRQLRVSLARYDDAARHNVFKFSELLLECSVVSELCSGTSDQAKLYAYFATHDALAELIQATADGSESYESAAIVLAQSTLDPAHAGLRDLRRQLVDVREYLERTERGEGDGTQPLDHWTPAMRTWLAAVPSE